MPISTEELLQNVDIFIDYEFEEVMFRREYKSGNIYRKFYSEGEHTDPIPFDNRLYTDALRFGVKISEDEYSIGKKKKG